MACHVKINIRFNTRISIVIIDLISLICLNVVGLKQRREEIYICQKYNFLKLDKLQIYRFVRAAQETNYSSATIPAC
jgi:hypothetical protein